jgi:cytochrome c55X
MMARGAAAILLVLISTAVYADITPSRQRELVHLVQHDCGSCHGLTLQGGLGPPLTPAALVKKSPATLQTVILDGLLGTPMPPWRPFLSETEATWLVDMLKQGKFDAN